MIPANLVEAFGLLINCNESSPCHPFLPTVQHTLKKAMDPQGLFYLASKQFTTEDFEKVKEDKMLAQNVYCIVSQFFHLLFLHLFARTHTDFSCVWA